MKKSNKKLKPPQRGQVNLQASAVNAKYELAVNFLNQNELAKAEAAIDECLRLKPAFLLANNVKAILAVRQHRYEEAEKRWLKIVELKPSDADAYSNLGNLYRLLNWLDEAVSMLKKAIELNPQHADAIMNLGVTYHYQKEPDLALEYYDKAIALKPDSVQSHFNKGRLLQEYCDFSAAFEQYREALALDPSHYGANANLAMTQYYHAPFDAVAASQVAKQIGANICQGTTPYKQWQSTNDLDSQLKVGLVSGDLRDHSVGRFLQPVLEHIDKDQIALCAYANSAIYDDTSTKLNAHCTHWQTVDTLSDEELAKRIHADGIDILIDLSGHTGGNRLKTFAYKPAPVQATWLGYFATTGLPQMDYIIADPYCLPESEADLYSEQPWRLPYSRLFLFKPKDTVASPLPSLESNTFTFGCFQSLEKINNEVLRLWHEILQQAPHSRLRIQSINLDANHYRQRFTSQINACGIDPSRIELVGAMPMAEYQRAYSYVDIVLDTFPYTGGTTTVEALWAGVPTITYTSPGMLGRQGEQLMTAAGLGDWVCPTREAYVKKAVHYATGDLTVKQELNRLRASLPQLLATRPAANTQAFTDSLMQAWRGMWREFVSK